MRRYLLFLIFVLCLSFTSGAEARKLALLVGVDEYDYVTSLECCVNDMKVLKEALIKIGFEEDDIQMLLTDNTFKNSPTKKKIEKRIAELLSNAQPSDMVFIALSGHGAQEEKDVYFCPPDAEIDDLEGTCVSITKIMDDLSKCKAQFKWLVVDACRNDPKKGIGDKGLRVIPTPPAGIALFQSCAEGEESWEDRETGNGFFTKNFAAALSGEADSDHDGKLTLMEVCKWTTAKTKEQVKNSHKKTQRPYFSGSVSDFTLIENQDFLKAKELAVAARSAMDAEDYDLAVEKYDAALAIYPNHAPWKRDRDLADRLRKPKFNPMKIVVPDDFATIEDAYKNVQDGGTITIQPGRYELSATIEVNRPVTFRSSTGQPEDVVIDCPSSHAFKITDGSPSFQNLTVSSGGEEKAGFWITGGTPKLFRCIVTSRKGRGILVQGEKADAQVESCTIKNCGMAGVIVVNKGLGSFTDCEIFGNAFAGIQVNESGNPTVTECKIHDGKESGITIYNKGLGTFSDCEIYGNAKTGIGVSESGNPTVVGCKIYNGKAGGVRISEKGLGKFDDCEIYGNAKSGIEVTTFGNPTVAGCKIHDGKQGGVMVIDNGFGVFNDCDIYGNSLPGIQVYQSGNPTVTRCKIHDGKMTGVDVFNNGMGTFNNNTLERNYWNGNIYNWFIRPDAGEVKGYGNTPPIPTR